MRQIERHHLIKGLLKRSILTAGKVKVCPQSRKDLCLPGGSSCKGDVISTRFPSRLLFMVPSLCTLTQFLPFFFRVKTLLRV